MEVSYKFPENPLGPVAPHGNAKSFPHDDTHLRDWIVPPAGQQVEALRRNTPASSLDPLDVST